MPPKKYREDSRVEMQVAQRLQAIKDMENAKTLFATMATYGLDGHNVPYLYATDTNTDLPLGYRATHLVVDILLQYYAYYTRHEKLSSYYIPLDRELQKNMACNVLLRQYVADYILRTKDVQELHIQQGIAKEMAQTFPTAWPKDLRNLLREIRGKSSGGVNACMNPMVFSTDPGNCTTPIGVMYFPMSVTYNDDEGTVKAYVL